MSCAFEEELTAYIDGELPPLKLKQVEAHLPGCESCRTTHALLQRTVHSLAALPAFEPSSSMRREVLRRLDEEPQGWLTWLKAFLRPGVLIPALGTVAALGVAVVLSRPDAGLDLADASHLELAANMEVAEDLEVLGMESPSDLEVIANLHELEETP